jgi:hypothetical protein
MNCMTDDLHDALAGAGLAGAGPDGAEPDGAEEIIDEVTKIISFRGSDVRTTIGRVLVHALSGDARTQCGLDADALSRTGRRWDTGSLPHLLRCAACGTASRSGGVTAGPVDRQTGAAAIAPGAPASGVEIRPAHGTDTEIAGADALREVLAEHDLRRWMFTDLVTVDAEIRGGFSHPLTISPKLLLRRPGCALTTFLHEQLHWIDGQGMDDATAEAKERWPDPPSPPAGALDPESTWLHLPLCALEYASLRDLIGSAEAAAELTQHDGYSWIYGQILANPAWFGDFLDRHGLCVPEHPPVPRRYFGDAWWTSLL